MITLGALNDITGLRHGYFTRVGGVSTGLYASLNCGFGSKDDPAAVSEVALTKVVELTVMPVPENATVAPDTKPVPTMTTDVMMRESEMADNQEPVSSWRSSRFRNLPFAFRGSASNNGSIT